MKRIAIFASGAGTNAKNIIQHFHLNPKVKVECIVCNNQKAGVIDVAKQADLPYYFITKHDLYETDHVVELLRESHIDLIVLAGFLWKIPEKILLTYPNRLLNIHPALLPKFGGAGMYGINVHDAVVRAGEKETGVTVHLVNEKFDEGKIVFQRAIKLEEADTAQSVAAKIQQIEYECYPKVIEEFLNNLS